MFGTIILPMARIPNSKIAFKKIIRLTSGTAEYVRHKRNEKTNIRAKERIMILFRLDLSISDDIILYCSFSIPPYNRHFLIFDKIYSYQSDEINVNPLFLD